jgi:predicted ABC-type ATPase
MTGTTRCPRCIIIAGPNGAGKTTFAREFLPKDAGIVHFVNADLIAAGLSPLRPELAALAGGRLFLAELDRLPSPRLALRRIAARVRQGGHDVPRADVLRRFERGWLNFREHYRSLADHWEVYDNSLRTPCLIEIGPRR